MAYESFSYDIKERLPEWWKHDAFLEPINRYSQELIRDIIGGLLGNFGVVQPFQVWKTLPTEYSWTHVYQSDDSYLKTPQGGLASLFLSPNQPVYAHVPNSKRNCHAVIQLQLQGDHQGLEKPLSKLTIKNANQSITFNNITTTTDIKIFTEDNSILIDGVPRHDLVKGRFDKIYPQARNINYDQVDIDDENKDTYISIESDTAVTFSLKIKLIHPIYVTEQNMRIHTVSAFPIEWVKLYGFYCHEFNNKQEWRFLWEKNYKQEERVVYDRITKQFDCETFYIQVKLYGIGATFFYGFPQEELSSNPAFQTNKNLDKWGKIYGLPRRVYKTHISEDEEPYTYPPFYNYEIEQDYWYEERLVNEYRHNDDAINATLVKDSDLNNIAVLQCIDPSIHDIYVYTETIKSSIDNKHYTDNIYPTYLSESGEGVTWQTPHEIVNTSTTATEVSLAPQSAITFNTKENQTKILEIGFDDIPDLPKNIEIKGIELQLHGLTDIHSDSLILDNRSQLLLESVYTKANGESITTTDNIQINNEIQYWEKGKGVYKIGGPTDLFNLSEIKRDQIKNGLRFNLAFTNLNTFLKATIVLYSVDLKIYYEILEDSYDFNVEIDNTEIVLTDPQKQNIQMLLNFKNTGTIPVVNKNVYIATAEGIDITNNKFRPFDLDVDEEFTIGKLMEDQIIITPKQYEYLSLVNNDETHKYIDINENHSLAFYYKTNNQATIEIYINGDKKDEIIDNTSSWQRYEYIIPKEEFESLIESDNNLIDLKIKVKDSQNNVFLKQEEWDEYSNSISISRQVKTGLYDIIVFCDDKSIKRTITIKEVE